MPRKKASSKKKKTKKKAKRKVVKKVKPKKRKKKTLNKPKKNTAKKKKKNIPKKKNKQVKKKKTQVKAKVKKTKPKKESSTFYCRSCRKYHTKSSKIGKEHSKPKVSKKNKPAKAVAKQPKIKEKKVKIKEEKFEILPINEVKIDYLVEKGRSQGFVTEDEILCTIPDVEEHLEEVEEFIMKLFKFGIDIVRPKEKLLSITEAGEKEDLKPKVDLSMISPDSIQMYLKEIGKIDLLTKAEEVELAKKKDRGDKDGFKQMIEANLRLVVSIA
ncbi:MAG: hypothetical protein HQ538_05255, partial [Parcubacteria group bacterium]|nr:hypothetical protein [Parcubacteria group bacterium]